MQTPAQVVTYIADTSDEEEDMAPKTGPSLKELMWNRNKAHVSEVGLVLP